MAAETGSPRSTGGFTKSKRGKKKSFNMQRLLIQAAVRTKDDEVKGDLPLECSGVDSSRWTDGKWVAQQLDVLRRPVELPPPRARRWTEPIPPPPDWAQAPRPPKLPLLSELAVTSSSGFETSGLLPGLVPGSGDEWRPPSAPAEQVLLLSAGARLHLGLTEAQAFDKGLTQKRPTTKEKAKRRLRAQVNQDELDDASSPIPICPSEFPPIGVRGKRGSYFDFFARCCRETTKFGELRRATTERRVIATRHRSHGREVRISVDSSGDSGSPGSPRSYP